MRDSQYQIDRPYQYIVMYRNESGNIKCCQFGSIWDARSYADSLSEECQKIRIYTLEEEYSDE